MINRLNHHRFFCIQASASLSLPQVFWTPTQSFLAPSYVPEAAPFIVSQPSSVNKNAEKIKSASAFFNIKTSSFHSKCAPDAIGCVGIPPSAGTPNYPAAKAAYPTLPPQRRRTQHSDMLGWVYVGVGISSSVMHSEKLVTKLFYRIYPATQSFFYFFFAQIIY